MVPRQLRQRFQVNKPLAPRKGNLFLCYTGLSKHQSSGMIGKPWPKMQVRRGGRGSQDSKKQWEKGSILEGEMGNLTVREYASFQRPSGNPRIQG